jgi:hypothetical protein
MAILTHAVVPGLDQPTYDTLFEQVRPQLTSLPGFIAHLAGPVEGGWAVTEIWASQEAADEFLRDILAPIITPAGVGMPDVHIQQLHNVVFASQG